jgi:hypothetical protein
LCRGTGGGGQEHHRGLHGPDRGTETDRQSGDHRDCEGSSWQA